MSEEVKVQNWSKGANNRAPANRLPEGYARDLVNLHPIGQDLVRRPGGTLVLEATAARGAFPHNGGFLLVDGDKLHYVDQSMAKQELKTVPASGPVAFVEQDSTVYASVGADVFAVVGTTIVPWGLPTPAYAQSNPGAESKRKVAVTNVHASGLESGATPAVAAGDEVTVPAPATNCAIHIYASAEDGEELYFQRAVTAAGTYPLLPTEESTETLQTQHVIAPPPAASLTKYQGMLFGVSGNIVFHTLPMQPHHVDMVENFFQYPVPVTAIAGGKAGVYVGADKLYLLRFSESGPVQSVVSEYPGVPGGGYRTSNGEAVMMTTKAVFVEAQDNRGYWNMVPSAEAAYAIAEFEGAALGEVDYDGEKLLVASGAGKLRSKGGLAASDFYETEVIRP